MPVLVSIWLLEVYNLFVYIFDNCIYYAVYPYNIRCTIYCMYPILYTCTYCNYVLLTITCSDLHTGRCFIKLSPSMDSDHSFHIHHKDKRMYRLVSPYQMALNKVALFHLCYSVCT